MLHKHHCSSRLRLDLPLALFDRIQVTNGESALDAMRDMWREERTGRWDDNAM